MAKQKSRTHKVSPNTAGTARRTTQELMAAVNKDIVSKGGLTPWQLSKKLRLKKRIAAGKTYENFMKKRVSIEARKYKTTGPNAAV